jgi:hypothetical protein
LALQSGALFGVEMMTEKLSRYRKLAESLTNLGTEQAQAINSQRYMLMYHYFLRCGSLTSAVILLLETKHTAAAYALQKSLVDSLLNGLYLGYVATEKEINETITMAQKGRCTGHSRMHRRAKMLDHTIRQRCTFMTGMFADLIKNTSEQLNEFGHGGLLSTMLDTTDLPAEVGYKVVSQCVFLLHMFLANVFLLENLDLSQLQKLQEEFAGIGGELVPVKC